LATNVPPVRPSVRELREQASQTVRKTVTFADGNLAAGIPLPASLPAGALITSLLVLVETAFSAGSALLIGTTATGNDLAAAADTAATAAGVKRVDTATLKGRLAADTPMFVSATGAPTAGVATIVVHFTPNNDA